MQIIFDALPPKNIFQLWFDLGDPDDGKKNQRLDPDQGLLFLSIVTSSQDVNPI
jgi:hypothetical protein